MNGMNDPFDAVHARLLELPVFFVGGMPRSGTTWVQQLLNAHRDVLCMGESRFFEDMIPGLFNMLMEYGQRRRDGYATWAPTVTGPDKAHMGPLFKAAFASLAGANLGDKNPEQLVTIGEKTPDNLTSLRRLWQIYPAAKFIHVIRDPRDGAISGYIRFRARLPEEMSHEEYAVSYCELWRDRILEARTLAKHRAFMEVRYEDLHRDTERHAAAIFRFLDVSDEPELVSAAVERASFEQLSGGRKRGEADAGSHYRQGTVGGWRDTLTEREKQRVQDVAGTVLADLGYTD